MDRRNFIKVSGAAAAGLALSGCAPKAVSEESPLVKEWPAFPERITREVDAFGPLNLKEITVEIGLRKPFDVMHVSDTHIARADARDNERKIMLAARRSQHMNAGEHYLDEAVRIPGKGECTSSIPAICMISFPRQTWTWTPGI